MEQVKRMLLDRYDEEGNYQGRWEAIGTPGAIDDYLSELWARIGDDFELVSSRQATQDELDQLHQQKDEILFDYAKQTTEENQ